MEVKVLNEILEMFVLPKSCEPRNCPSIFEQPRQQNGFVFGTSDVAMIKIKTDHIGLFETVLKPDLSTIYEVAYNCNDVIDRACLELALSNPPLVDEEDEVTQKIKCVECDGEGEVYAEYDGKDEVYNILCGCPVCDGTGVVEYEAMVKTGKQVVAYDYSVEVNGIFLFYPLAERLFKTMQLLEVESCIQRRKDELSKNVYLIGDVTVLLMARIIYDDEE